MAKNATLKVKAATANRVPMIGSGGVPAKLQWIGDEPVEVPNVRYYRKRIKAGDLVEVQNLAVSPMRTARAAVEE